MSHPVEVHPIMMAALLIWEFAAYGVHPQSSVLGIQQLPFMDWTYTDCLD